MADEENLNVPTDWQNKAYDWLKEYLPNLECECCRTKKWEMRSEFVSLITYAPGRNITDASVYPCFTLLCRNCGNTKLFDAIATGVFPVAYGDTNAE